MLVSLLESRKTTAAVDAGMIIYFAIGEITKRRIEVFQDMGVNNVLISYADFKGKQNIKIPFSNVFLDSGAFSVATGKQKVTLKSYTLWLEMYLDKYPQIKHYVNFDDLNDPAKSKQNFDYMLSKGLSPVPVYHYKEPTEYLDEMCANYEYVGLGGMAVGRMNTGYLKKFWEWVFENYPDNKFHLFGTTAVNAFTRYQPFSIDSTGWLSADEYRNAACYKNGLPAFYNLPTKSDGIELFFTSEELWRLNLRAMLDWENMKWLANVKKDDPDAMQAKMF